MAKRLCWNDGGHGVAGSEVGGARGGDDEAVEGGIVKRGSFCFLLALFVFQLASCTAALKRPEIGLSGIELVGLGFAEQRFMLKLSIRNPNEEDFLLTALEFDLEFNGAYFSRAAAVKAVMIPRQGEALVEVMTVSRLSQLVGVWRDMRKQGRDLVTYRIVGRAEVKGFGRIPFERQGELSVSAFGKIAPK